MTKTILVVEDDALNMEMFTRLLEESGYRAVQSSDGKDVVDLAKRHAPDLVLMDIQLPESSGLECALRLKTHAELKDIPIVAITAYDLDGGVERIFAAGIIDVLGKPIDPEAFLTTIAKYTS